MTHTPELVAALREALQKIIDMNVQYAIDRYGDASEAETMCCVIVARAALATPASVAVDVLCPDCDRHVMATPVPATGFLAACGKRLTRPQECGVARRCKTDEHGETILPSTPPPTVGADREALIGREAKRLASASKAFLAYFNPNDLPEDKSQQWLSVVDQIANVEAALEALPEPVAEGFATALHSNMDLVAAEAELASMRAFKAEAMEVLKPFAYRAGKYGDAYLQERSAVIAGTNLPHNYAHAVMLSAEQTSWNNWDAARRLVEKAQITRGEN